MKTKLSPLLSAFVAAHNAHDSKAFIACFADNATVHDEGHEHTGTPAIKVWFEEVSRKYRMVLQVTDVAERGENVTLASLVSGNFDGSPIELRYRLASKNGKITALKIAP